jgi:3-oxoacyl-[acyl-carrier protein] reductase
MALHQIPQTLPLVAGLDLLQADQRGADPAAGHDQAIVRQFVHVDQRSMVRQRSGRIIAVSSVVGQMGNAGQTNYAASKAGLIGFAKALAREVASRAITVNVIAPGMIETDMTRAIADKAQGEWAAQIPLGRLGSADDVAAAACFLASDEAAYITGHVLAVNGGMYT